MGHATRWLTRKYSYQFNTGTEFLLSLRFANWWEVLRLVKTLVYHPKEQRRWDLKGRRCNISFLWQLGANIGRCSTAPDEPLKSPLLGASLHFPLLTTITICRCGEVTLKSASLGRSTPSCSPAIVHVFALRP